MVTTTFAHSKAFVWDPHTGRRLLGPIPCNSSGFDYNSRPPLPGERSFSTRDPWVLIPQEMKLQIVNFQSGEIRILQHETGISVAQFSRDGATILTGDTSGSVISWDARTGSRAQEPTRLPGAVLAFNRDGTRAVVEKASAETTDPPADGTASGDTAEAPAHDAAPGETDPPADGASFEVWNLGATGAPPTPCKVKARGKFHALSEDGNWVCASVGGDNDSPTTLYFCDVESGNEHSVKLENIPADAEFIDHVEFSADGRLAVTAAHRFSQTDLIARNSDMIQTGQMRVTKPASGEQLCLIPHRVGMANPTEGYHPYRARLSPDTARVASLAFEDRALKISSAQLGTALNESPGVDADFSAVAFHPGGKSILTGSFDGSARVWDIQPTAPVFLPLRIQGNFESARFSLDGKLVVLMTGDTAAACYDIETGKSITPLPGEFTKPDPTSEDASGQRKFVPFAPGENSPDQKNSPDEENNADQENMPDEEKPRRLVITASGEPLVPELKLEAADRARFSLDGQRVLKIQNGEPPRLSILNARTGGHLHEPIPNVSDAWFSPAGEQILLNKSDGLTIMDLATGRELIDPIRLPGLLAAAISANGLVAVASSNSGTTVHRFNLILDRAPELLSDFAEAIGQRALNEFGIPEERSVTIAALRPLAARLEEGAAPSSFAAWLKWFVAPRESRPIGPDTTITMPQYLSQLIDRATPESLNEAELLAFGDKDLRSRIEAKRAELKAK